MAVIARNGAILDLTGVPVPPERFLSLAGALASAGFSHLILRWGELFPWTVTDPDDRKGAAFPDTIFPAFRRSISGEATQLIPGIDLACGLDEFFFSNVFRRAALFTQSVSSFREGSDTAFHLAKHAIDDLLSLHEGAGHIYLGGSSAAPTGVPPSLMFEHYLAPLLRYSVECGVVPIIHQAALDEVDETVLGPWLKTCRCVVLNAEPDAALRIAEYGVEVWPCVEGYSIVSGTPEPTGVPASSPAIVDCRVRMSPYDPATVLIDEYLPQLLSLTKVPALQAERDAAARVAATSGALRAAVRECWEWLRRSRECLSMAILDPRRRSPEGLRLRRLLDLAKLSAGTASLYAHELRELGRGKVEAGQLDELFAVQLGPVEEELSELEARSRPLSGFRR